MKLIKHILEVKGPEVWTISPDAMVYDALKVMAQKRVGALVVVENDKVVGVISERDYARKIILEGKTSKETTVKEIMATRVVYAKPEQSVEYCLALMTERHVRHLPVMVGDKMIGIVSIGDLVKAIIDHQKTLIKQLENYIQEKKSFT